MKKPSRPRRSSRQESGACSAPVDEMARRVYPKTVPLHTLRPHHYGFAEAKDHLRKIGCKVDLPPSASEPPRDAKKTPVRAPTR